MSWTPDSDTVNGLTDVGAGSRPTMFFDGTTLKLISGETDGFFNGWYWDGSTWVSDPDVIAGLPGGLASGDVLPTVFNDDGVLKLIAGVDYGIFHGFYWDGSIWISDAGVIAGLENTVPSKSAPTVFIDDGTLKLISGSEGGGFYGWYWSGSAWILDSGVINGLTDIGSRSIPTVFSDGGTLKLISGEYDGDFHGWYWNGTAWASDSDVIDGLGDIGWYSAPHTIVIDSTITLISGDYYGEFYGFTSPVSNLPPVADAGGPYTGNVGSEVSFDGSGSTDHDGTIVLYEWDFGDSETGVGVNANHIYTVASTYTVVLTVTDDGGLTDIDTTVATISEAVIEGIPDVFTFGRIGKKRRHRIEV